MNLSFIISLLMLTPRSENRFSWLDFELITVLIDNRKLSSSGSIPVEWQWTRTSRICRTFDRCSTNWVNTWCHAAPPKHRLTPRTYQCTKSFKLYHMLGSTAPLPLLTPPSHLLPIRYHRHLYSWSKWPSDHNADEEEEDFKPVQRLSSCWLVRS